MRVLLALGLTLLFVLAPARASAQEDAGDSAVPGGWFFTQAVPNGNGSGFAVQNGQGFAVWTAYLDAGGVQTLGYPISRRFELFGAPAQAFEFGILRLDGATGRAERVPLDALPGRRPPAAAVRPDQPPRAAAETPAPAWSGWWYPASDGQGPTLYAANGPLDKYDAYVELVTGASPGTRDWERRELYFPGSPWAGHCNGFAAAALLEPEPTEPVEVLGLTFSVADLKGLLVNYHFGDAAAWSFGADGALSPADFHRMLLDWMQVNGKGFVLTFDLGAGELWSYPVYAFDSEWRPDPVQADVWHVSTTVWMADMDVPANFVGTRPYPGAAGKSFEYTLSGDPRRPNDGAWTGISRSGRLAQPGRIWYPDPKVRNAERDLVAPGLDRQTLANILAGSDGTDVAVR